MSEKSRIEWTDSTWNPVTGCTKVSPGCAHCYAETVALRFWPKQYPEIKYTDEAGSTDTRPRLFTDVQWHGDRLDQPLRWKKSRKVFVNSMSDLFHEAVPDAFIDQVFAVMALAPQHTFQVLTKRADRMLKWFRVGVDNRKSMVGAAMRALSPVAAGSPEWPLPNVWLGVSVENQHFADERIPQLLVTPAAVRFVSYEPALGPVEFADFLRASWMPKNALGLDWVIAGGESGRDARPSDLTWYRNALEQCRASGVAFFMKQLGRNPYLGDGGGSEILTRSRPGLPPIQFYELEIDKGHGGDMTEWPADLRVRELPDTHA